MASLPEAATKVPTAPGGEPVGPQSNGAKKNAQTSDKNASGANAKPASTDGGAKTVTAADKKAAKEAKREKRAAAVAQRQTTGGGASQEAHGSKDAQASTRRSDRQSGPADGPSRSGTAAESSRQAQGTNHGSAPKKAGAGSSTQQVANLLQNAIPSSTQLFSHLPTARIPVTSDRIASGKYHPLIVRYGLLISTGAIRGSNARVIGLLCAFKEVIRDFATPSGNHQDWSRLLLAHLSPMISFLEECRPKGVGGGNAIRFMKGEINKIGSNPGIKEESEQKRFLLHSIDAYLRERIELAGQVICENAIEKIRPGDTIVTYARSSLVESVIIEAWARMQENDENDKFHVVVVDSSPLFEGRQLLKVLTASDIPASYCLLSSVSSILPRADLVLLGTSALLSDGSLYSRAGTAMVAMLAKESRVPVVACCETYKFGEKIVLDAVTGNELGDPALLIDRGHRDPHSRITPSVTAKDAVSELPATLKPIHLLYDLTPAALITAVCTEVGFIPASAVPTVMVKADAEIAF